MKLPPIFFDAYHPDLCYITDPEGRNLKGPLGDYHSLFAYCGYQLGVDRKSVIRLFNAQNYQAIGWLDLCKSARDRFRSEEHTSALQSLMRISSAVLCLKTNRRNIIIEQS